MKNIALYCTSIAASLQQKSRLSEIPLKATVLTFYFIQYGDSNTPATEATCD